jgi:hypothetical protein
MNSVIDQELPGIHRLRDQLFDMIADHDLAYKLPGHNPTLGELCLEAGMYQQIYSRSFKTFNMDWGYRGSIPQTTDSVEGFRAWFQALDAELVEALSLYSDEDLHNHQVDRGHGFTPSLYDQCRIYHEANLIFCAKASVYLKALEKQLTGQWPSWIG